METALFQLILFVPLLRFSFCTPCLPQCRCLWRRGKQTAECSSAGFYEIPSGLEPSIQVLDLSRNNLTLLPPNSFLHAGLINLQKLYLSSCGIEHIDDLSFNHLSNLVELDLRDNSISSVPTAAFGHLRRLRRLILSGNPLITVPAQAFVELKTLIALEMSNCNIHSIAIRAFEGLEKLEALKLDGNELQTLHAETMAPFTSLRKISLDGNPWTCDCEIRGLFQWLKSKYVLYEPPTCYSPVQLRNETWADENIDGYVCAPKFLDASVHVSEGSNISLACKVSGDPVPSLQWMRGERVISNSSEGMPSGQISVLSECAEKENISRLIILSIQETDAGVYTCVAENAAGKETKSFTLMVSNIGDTKTNSTEE